MSQDQGRKKESLAAHIFSSELARLVFVELATRDYQSFCLSDMKRFYTYITADGDRFGGHQQAQRVYMEFLANNKWISVTNELIFLYTIDLFERYLKDTLVLVYLAQPKLLSSKDTMVSVQEILAFDSLHEFVGRHARQRVDSLSRQKGLDGLLDAFKRAGINNVIKTFELDRIKSCIKVRNEIVHSNVMSEHVEFAHIFDRNMRKIKDEFPRFPEEPDLAQFFSEIVQRVDRNVVMKFNIGAEIPDIPDWLGTIFTAHDNTLS